MKSFNKINEIGNPLGIVATKCDDYNPSCPDYAPKYDLYFGGTRASDELGQKSYVSWNIKHLNEDFEEVYNLCHNPH